MTHKFKVDWEGIGSVIHSHFLRVPPYQRSYAWREENIAELYEDLFGAMQRGDHEYFLGSVVLVQEGEVHMIVDGQQRLATIAILLAAVRDFFKERNDRRASRIEAYLFEEELRTLEIVPKLT